MNRPNLFRTAGLALGLALLAACSGAPTKTTSVWVADGVTTLEAKSMLVVALAQNQATRQMMETQLVSRIKALNATESNLRLSAEELQDPARAVAKARADGFDKAAVVYLVDAQQHQVETPQTLPQAMGQQPFYAKTTSMTMTNFVLETVIYDVATAKALVRVRSESFQSADTTVLADRVFDSVRAALVERGLIK